eukprot:244844-Rhodomonas_salina.2
MEHSLYETQSSLPPTATMALPDQETDGEDENITSDIYSRWKPDGITYDSMTDTSTLLEFARCNNSRHSTLLEAVERKQVKYQVLLDAATYDSTTLTLGSSSSCSRYLGPQ